MKHKDIIIFLAIFMSLLACQAREQTIPYELLGVWETSEPKYKDCFFEIGEDTIIFLNKALPEPSIDSNIISRTEIASEDGETLYTIYYNKIGEEVYQFSFYYYQHDGSSIRFKNQKDIEWQKSDVQIIEDLFAESG
jgi:hypothetical protein